MRILILAPRACHPLNTGAKLRNYHLARQLALRAEVSFLAFEDEPGVAEGDLRSVCRKVVLVPRRQGYRPWDLLRGLVGPQPITVLNYTRDAMRRALGELLAGERFDLVHLEGLPMTGYLPLPQRAGKRPLVVLDWHNVDSEVMRRYAGNSKTALKRWYARLTAARIEAAERRALVTLDAHLAVSVRDRRRMLHWAPSARVEVIPNGVDVESFRDSRGEGPARNRILFVGSMDYHANAGAAVWFARSIWPRIREKRPELRFTIAGRNPTSEVRALASLPGVEVTGTVNDVRPLYREALALVVPLRAGGGSRLKILESMAAGVPVVSTRLGAEGLDVSHGTDILLADQEEELIDALSGLNAYSAQWQRLVTGGLQLVQTSYDWSLIGQSLWEFYLRLLKGEGPAVART